MILFKICYSIIKKNKGFTLCLFLMSLLCFIVSIIGTNFAVTSKASIDRFFVDTGCPDAFVETMPMYDEDFSYIANFDNVEDIDTRLVIESNIEIQDNKQFSGRLVTYDENGKYKLVIHSHEDVYSELPKIAIHYKFAEYHNIKIGDKIKVYGSIGAFDCVVESMAASIDSISITKDNFSSSEDYQFCYLYMTKTSFAKFASFANKTNSIFIYFNDDTSLEAKRETLSKIEDALGNELLSSTLLDDSTIIDRVNDNIYSIQVLCILIPGIIMLISLGFSFIFIKIIIENQKNTIALLKSLGYSSKKIFFIFMLFTLIINFSASIIGIPSGIFLCKLVTLLVVKSYGMMFVSFTFSALPSIGMILAVFCIGILSSLFTSKFISKIDPAMIKSMNSVNKETPRFAKVIRINPFMKIPLVSSLKNYLRLIIGILCVAFCIISISVGIEGVLTNDHNADAIYGDRFRYDLMIRDIDESDYNNIKDNISGIKTIQPATLFTVKVNNENINVSSIVDNSELVVLKNKNGEIVSPADGVIIDEMYSVINNVNIGDKLALNNIEFKVTGIARELSNNYFYISEKSANDIFSKSTNCAYIKAENTSNIEIIKKDISNINKDVYFTLLSLQNEDYGDRTKSIQMAMLILAILSFGMGSLFVFNICIIDFNEKKNEYVTLKALGASNNKICTVPLLENFIRLFFAIFIALLFNYLLIEQLLRQISTKLTQYVNVYQYECFFAAVGLSLIYLLISYFVSKRKLKRMDLLEELNEVE